MNGHLQLADSEDSQIPIRGPVAVYRDPDRGGEIIAATEEEEIPLGVSDATVSRMKNESAPIIIKPASDGIDIRNAGSENNITVRVDNEEQSVQEGNTAQIDGDVYLDVGFETTFKIVVE